VGFCGSISTAFPIRRPLPDILAAGNKASPGWRARSGPGGLTQFAFGKLPLLRHIPAAAAAPAPDCCRRLSSYQTPRSACGRHLSPHRPGPAPGMPGISHSRPTCVWDLRYRLLKEIHRGGEFPLVESARPELRQICAGWRSGLLRQNRSSQSGSEEQYRDSSSHFDSYATTKWFRQFYSAQSSCAGVLHAVKGAGQFLWGGLQAAAGLQPAPGRSLAGR